MTNDATLEQSWRTSFGSLPERTAVPGITHDIVIRIDIYETIPAPPAADPHFRQGELLHYYIEGDNVVAHFPRFGQLQLDLAQGRTEGRVVAAVLHTYGVLEDLIAISLSPHLRRRGLFLAHAFAAAHKGKAVLLVGGIGAGKTTTGMALLNAGWQLLSNDSPIIGRLPNDAGKRPGSPMVMQYPGVLAAYPETFARFPATHSLAKRLPQKDGRQKITVPAEKIWPGVWLDAAPVGAIIFPQIEQRPDHRLDPCRPTEALTRLMPHAIEQWDKAMIPGHLALLRQLVESAPAFILRLGPDVPAIPDLLRSALEGEHG
ncbi:MAG: hypothetical protein ACE5E7_19745 [Anaerolineae bacterium]